MRGGVFENTGFKVGAVTVIDPQTGHYVAELPVDPALLGSPNVLHGIDAAVAGFNSAVATIDYAIGELAEGGDVALGFGSDRLMHQSIRFAANAGENLAVMFSAARSEGDGTLPFGDHEFARYNLQLQHARNGVQSDLIVAYQDKFWGWPGAYTGFASLPETDDTQTLLVLANQRRESDAGWFEYGAFYRGLEDDYDFDRRTVESGTPGSFEHETSVIALGFQGSQGGGAITWRYGGQLTRDELVRSTDLTNGLFTTRNYATLTLVPTFSQELGRGSVMTWRAGLTADYSNRDSSEWSPLLGWTLRRDDTSGATTWSLDFARTTQLPGYTALNSSPVGLFGGNPFLGREVAEQLSLSVTREAETWQARATIFQRRDTDLVDWTFSAGAPFARQANPVDLDVQGIELFFTRRWQNVDLATGYMHLDKDADYGSAAVDASYYALNFARDRVTLALRYRFADSFELRLDNEYRRQEANPLRVGDDTTFLASASLRWNVAAMPGLGVALTADNITDSEFQPFPGTPASGRQYSVSATYSW